jgi:hypothetical protein
MKSLKSRITYSCSSHTDNVVCSYKITERLVLNIAHVSEGGLSTFLGAFANKFPKAYITFFRKGGLRFHETDVLKTL